MRTLNVKTKAIRRIAILLLLLLFINITVTKVFADEKTVEPTGISQNATDPLHLFNDTLPQSNGQSDQTQVQKNNSNSQPIIGKVVFSPLSSSDIYQLQRTNDTLISINESLLLLQRNSNIGVGGMQGLINTLLLDAGFNSAVNKNVYELHTIFIIIQAEQQGLITNGELRWYLQNHFSLDIDRNKSDLINELHIMYVMGINDLQTVAHAHSYSDYRLIPGIENWVKPDSDRYTYTDANIWEVINN